MILLLFCSHTSTICRADVCSNLCSRLHITSVCSKLVCCDSATSSLSPVVTIFHDRQPKTRFGTQTRTICSSMKTKRRSKNIAKPVGTKFDDRRPKSPTGTTSAQNIAKYGNKKSKVEANQVPTKFYDRQPQTAFGTQTRTIANQVRTKSYDRQANIII